MAILRRGFLKSLTTAVAITFSAIYGPKAEEDSVGIGIAKFKSRFKPLPKKQERQDIHYKLAKLFKDSRNWDWEKTKSGYRQVFVPKMTKKVRKDFPKQVSFGLNPRDRIDIGKELIKRIS